MTAYPDFDTLDLSIDPRGVAHLRLNRPEKHNALSEAMMIELTTAITALGHDKTVRVVVLGGRGRSFCAGGDLGWMAAQIKATDAERDAAARILAGMLGAINLCPKPVIGRIHGNTFGGGVGLAAVCDVAFAADTAMFGLTETRLGLIPATIGPYVIARMGEGMARRVFMSSRRFDALEARDLNLVARVVEAADLDAAVAAEVDAYLQCAPGAVAHAKALARDLGPTIDEAQIALSVAALIRQWQSDEAAEGIAAFFDKRPAAWMV